MLKHTKPGGVIYVCHADTEGLQMRSRTQDNKLAECFFSFG